MQYVALFRNLNLGHRGSPDKTQLLEAFGGPQRARSFQTNGTVLFDSAVPGVAASTASAALAELGYEHPMMVRSLPEVEQVVASTREAGPEEGVYRIMVSFFDLPQPPDLELPLRKPDGLVEIRRLDATGASTACWKRGESVGDVTGWLESLLQVPATSRTLGTMRRLVAAAHRTSS